MTRIITLLLLILINVNADNHENMMADKAMKIDKKTLLQKVWPGMTIEQSMQVLGKPEEVMPVTGNCSSIYTSKGSQAVRYGMFWLIPPYDRNQITCIVNQKGIKTYRSHICGCKQITSNHIISKQN